MHEPQEPDHVPSRPVLWAALITVVLSTLYVTLAWGLDACGHRPAPTPWTTLPEEQNEIEVSRFDEPTAAERAAAAAWARLQRYGWVDRDAGVIHIPIDRAIDLYLDDRAIELYLDQEERPQPREERPQPREERPQPREERQRLQEERPQPREERQRSQEERP